MEFRERDLPWLTRVESLIEVLDGTSIGELELREAGTEIIIRRRPEMVLVTAPIQQVPGAPQVVTLNGTPAAPAPAIPKGQAVTAPLTGVYYSAPSPSEPPFVNIGDMVHVGQVVALVEAMKVFNEIQSEISGHVVALPAKNGDVVQKGDALIRVE